MLIINIIGQIVALIFSLLKLFSIFKDLNVQHKSDGAIINSKAEEQPKNDSVKDNNSNQENKVNNNIKNENIDSTKNNETNFLQNKSYFYTHCKNTKTFDSLPDKVKTLYFTEFNDYIEKNSLCEKYEFNNGENKSQESFPIKNKEIEATLNREKEKNRLINKIFFIINNYGDKTKFLKLDDDIQTLNPKEFESYAEKNFKR
jgi:1,2-phenylacetyl-CoA epoxidase PaaB subunit